jgi:Domain of unknown function (DUF4359)
MSLTFGLGEIVLVGLGVWMTMTNPQKQAYENYAVQEIDTYLKENFCTQLPKGLDSILKGQCHTMLDVARPQLEEKISQVTTRQNFVLFSIYQTQLSLPFSDLEYNFSTLGFCQNFFVYEAE